MKRPLPPTYFVVALVSAVLLDLLAPIRTLVVSPFSWLGLLPLGLGLFLNIAASRRFEGHGTTIKPFERSTVLVREFPFSLSRNPMYVGLTLGLLGVGTLLGSVTAFLPGLVFPIVIHHRFVRTEERMLAEAFPDEWDDYTKQVRRWV